MSEIKRKPQELDNYLKARLWVGDNGQIVCTFHGGHYLLTAVEAEPKRVEHQTPLNHWLDITNHPDFTHPCEICMAEAEVYESD